MTADEQRTGACWECGQPVHIVALDRVRDVDRTRIIGGQPGRIHRREDEEFVSRIVCDEGHIWWRAHDD